MNCIFFQVKAFRMAAFAFAMLALLLAGAVRPAQAQTYPVSFVGATQSWGADPNLWGSVYDPYDVNALATGDFNGDGKLDIVTGSYGGGTIGLLLGNGDNTFQPPLTIAQLSASVMSVVVGDFNGDGQLDVAALLLFSGSTMAVNVYLGKGDGTFSTATKFPLPGYTRVTATSLATGDFNGKLGLVVVDSYDGAVDVLLGNGDGTFKSPVAYSTIDPKNPGFTTPYGVTVADFNGDGQPDIAVGEYAGIAVLLNNGNGTFGAAVYYSDNVNSGLATSGIAAADLNHDKKIDIVLATGLGLVPFLNNGKGVFTPQALVGSGLDMTLVAIADVNGDGKPDLVAADLVGSIRIFLGKGTGTFTSGAQYPVGVGVSQEVALVVGDFNTDGHMDFAVGNNQGGQVLSALGNGDGTFRTTTEYGWQSTGSGYNVVAADFNGDGFPDVAYSGEFGTNAGSFAVMLGSSHGVLASQTYVPAGCNNYFGPNLVEWVAAGDVNGDGKADMVATLKNSTETGCQSGTLAVVLGLGTGKFKAPVFYSTGSTAQSYEVKLADLTGNGKLDVVTANDDGTLSVLLNKGNGTFKPGDPHYQRSLAQSLSGRPGYRRFHR
ncbi:MAG: VCBS repeat-containing protein [Terriglobales bacterium]